jgi:thioredoxin-related protein
MRKVVTVLMIVAVAFALAACGSAPSTSSTTSTSKTPAVVPVTQPANTAQTAGTATGGDIYSPTQTVLPNEMISTDASLVPATVLANVAAQRAQLIYFYDPTTKVAADQLSDINVVQKEHVGAFQVVTLDYTAGLASSATSASVDPEAQKIEMFASAMRVNTTPFIVLADRFGRVTYKFAGWADRGMLTREVLRAIQ